ncbi:creatininase family protein [Streptomyces chilikensis]|uniref:creatininase family protein n=1 Tax=Streptomyces chilikensis TaxID=1194079 RepID=UPI001F0E8751|nr:creatininase family protein [Streptomyces chilikensis]
MAEPSGDGDFAAGSCCVAGAAYAYDGVVGEPPEVVLGQAYRLGADGGEACGGGDLLEDGECLNGHGGNYVLSNLVQEANVDGPAVSLFPLGGDWDRACALGGLESDRHADMHAGEIETSILLHAAPELVRDGYEEADHDGGARRFLLVEGMSAYTENGVIGFPSLAGASKGKAVLESLTADFAAPLDALGVRVTQEGSERFG